jgi:hypothetical protein
MAGCRAYWCSDCADSPSGLGLMLVERSELTEALPTCDLGRGKTVSIWDACWPHRRRRAQSVSGEFAAIKHVAKHPDGRRVGDGLIRFVVGCLIHCTFFLYHALNGVAYGRVSLGSIAQRRVDGRISRIVPSPRVAIE